MKKRSVLLLGRWHSQTAHRHIKESAMQMLWEVISLPASFRKMRQNKKCLNRIPTKSFHYGLKKKKNHHRINALPSSPHSNWFDASKSMRGGLQMYMSEWMDPGLIVCQPATASAPVMFVGKSEAVPVCVLQKHTCARMSVMPSSFSPADMVGRAAWL